MQRREYTLQELSDRTGLSARTIRSYIAQDLLRGPDTVGRNAAYSDYHLKRLEVIRQLRDFGGMSLSEIRRYFLMANDEEEFGGAPVGSMRPEDRFQKPTLPVSLTYRKPSPFDQASMKRSSFYRETADTSVAGLLELLRSSVNSRRIARQANAQHMHEIEMTPEVSLIIRGGFRRPEIELFERLADALREALLGGVTGPGEADQKRGTHHDERGTEGDNRID